MDPIVIIDLDRCVGCYMCQKACALAQCIEINSATRFAEVVRPEDCTGCKACERACPYNCIIVLSDENEVPTRAKITLSRVRRFMNKRLITINPNASVKEGAEIMVKEKIGSLIIQGKPMIVTETDLLEAWIHGKERERIINFAKNAITIDSKETVNDALQIMLEYKIGHLPVYENGKLAGVLSITDVLRSLSSTSSLGNSVISVNPKEKIGKYSLKSPVIGIIKIIDVYKILLSENLKAIVVKDMDKVGIISIRDLTKYLSEGKSIEDNIDPRWIKPISANEEMSKAIALMSEHNLRHLPVNDDGELKILSVKEITKHAIWVILNYNTYI
ncbi:CBS domain-containing protein [Acidianus manzaensis]|uniref:Signal transduction protein n=1 Tax=Acidianus manzaensis TaxID=282676 RepID=A0A1W6JZ60_9CREN|nr:CBS domain-containing protein [Acidianus manzaensis]ARM75549.1 signal transduction protein [Acidianus manzaensis]